MLCQVFTRFEKSKFLEGIFWRFFYKFFRIWASIIWFSFASFETPAILGDGSVQIHWFLKSENSVGQKCRCEYLFNCMCFFNLYSRKPNFTIHHGNYFSWNIGSCHLDHWECQQLQNFVQCLYCTRNKIL